MFGYQVGELEHDLSTWQRLVHPDDRTALSTILGQHLRGEPGPFEVEARFRHKEGRWVWALVRGKAVARDDRGEPVRVAGTFTDVTKRKAAESALREMQLRLALKKERLEELSRTLVDRVHRAVAQLRAQDQLLLAQGRQAAMGEMLGNIAHQWRQPLTVLGMLLHNLRRASHLGKLDDPMLQETAERGDQLIRKMSTTISDFTNFFRPGKERVAFSALDQVRETLGLIDASLREARICVEVEAESDPRLVGFPNEFSQVLLNLFSNARQAIEGAQVEQGRVRIWVGERDGQGCVCVSDNGGGVPQACLDRVFDLYFTTKEDGSGIGLYMSRQIVEREMGGRLAVRNIEGGAEFTVLAPLAIGGVAQPAESGPARVVGSPAPDSSRPGAALNPPSTSPSGAAAREPERVGATGPPSPAAVPDAADLAWLAKLTVLYVEDDEAIRQPLGELLRRRVGRVLEAEDGAAGLARFREERPALVVTDLELPRLDGLEMARQIRLLDPGVPIVVTTAFEQTSYLLRSIELGLDRYVTKPVDADALDAALCACARRLRAEAMLAVESRRERERLKAHEQEVVSLLAGGMAHDFNNLLQGILGFVALAQQEAPAGSELRELLDDAMRAFPQARELAERLTTLSDSWLGNLQPGPIGPTLRAGAGRALEGCATALRLELPELLPSIAHDAELLGRAFGQLAQNAREAMDDHGLLTVAGRVREVAEGEVPQLAAGKYLELAFRDTGPGIPPEVLPRIFDPYFSTKPRGAVRGMGLGLSLCQAVLRRHRGLVLASSRQGEGASFTVLLPIRERTAS
jgi:PAS domain S-box-containing protein